MKKIIVLLFISLFGMDLLFSQTVPQGIQYQAVARNADGTILPNEIIDLQIALVSKEGAADRAYIENHQAKSNKLGLFTLIIGNGDVVQGDFKEIPWSTEEIWMELSMLDESANDFILVHSSKLLAVPYAFHANTANQISGENDDIQRFNSKAWYVEGNTGTSSDTHFLGTVDDQHLIFKTRDIERMQITSKGRVIIEDADIEKLAAGTGDFDGTVNVGGELRVEQFTNFGDNVQIEKGLDVLGNGAVRGNLTVGENHYILGSLSVKGESEFEGDVTFGNDIFVKRDGNFGRDINVVNDANIGANLKVDAETDLNGNLRVNNESSTVLSGTLNVDGATDLAETLNVDGETDLNSPLRVNNNSSTDLTGTLNVDGVTDLNSTFNVNNNAASNLSGTLKVDGITNLNAALNVKGGSPTDLSGTLGVTGNSTFKGNVTIENSDLNLTNSSGGFVASFTNTNGGNGDGIRISLGKNESRNPTTIVDPFAQYVSLNANSIKSFVSSSQTGSFDISQVLGYLNTANTTTWTYGAACSMSEQLAQALNDGLLSQGANLLNGIPLFNGASLDVLPTVWKFIDDFDFSLGAIPNDWYGGPDGDDECQHCGLISISVPQINLPDIPLPQFPTDFCANFGVNFTKPAIVYTNVPFSLTKENEFIRFDDRNSNRMGTIRANSIEDWANGYFDPTYAVNFVASVVGIDLVDGLTGAIGEFSTIVKSYNKIGVEYSSGNGDYAEWLPRLNASERISQGDIVGVKGGQITKNIEDAEQIMAISARPIVLGNIPDASQIDNGNNVAFMGQIPVKVMGTVKSGDYIVADSGVPGYGIAIAPEDMRLDDLKLAVGRSWETHISEGPKMVNTVIGVQTGDYFEILKKYEEQYLDTEAKLSASEARMESIEAKVELLTNLMSVELND